MKNLKKFKEKAFLNKDVKKEYDKLKAYFIKEKIKRNKMEKNINCDGCCNKVNTKMDLLFGMLSNQILVAESLASLQQTRQLVQAMNNSKDKDNVQEEIKKAQDQMKQIEEQIKVYRDSTLKVIAIYNNAFGQDADTNISELIKHIEENEETKDERSPEE